MPDPVGEAFLRALAPFRRRLRAVAFVRRATIACALGLLAADGAVAIARPAAPLTIAWCGVGIAAALFATLGLSLLRDPSYVSTALEVDRRCHLDNRAISALQFSTDADPVSRLIVSDATLRLQAISPQTLTFDIPSHARTLGVVAAAFLVALLFVHPGSGTRARSSRARGGMLMPSGAPSSAARAATDGQKVADSAQTATRNEELAPPPGAATGGVEPSSTSAPPAVGEASPPHASASETATTPPPSAGERESAAGDRGAPEAGASSTGAGRAGGSTSGLAPQGEHSAAGTAAGAAALGTGAERGVGGVSGAAPSGRDASPTQSNGGLPGTYAAAYQAARARAEAAITQDRVPPRLRAYVRDYFQSVRPSEVR